MKSPKKNKKYIQNTFQNKEKTKLFNRLYYLLAVLIIFVALLMFRFIPNGAEIWMRYFYTNLQIFLGPLFSRIPFSLTEIFFLFLIIFSITMLVLIIRNIAKKNALKGLNKGLSLLIVFSSVATYYFATAGIAYGRDEMKLPQHQESVETEMFVEVIEFFIDDFNECSNHLSFDENGSVINPYQKDEINSLLQEEFIKLDANYFSSFTPNIKYLLSSYMYREFNIAGISFAPFFEANVNHLVPDAQIVSTMAHEIAHTKGVMREQDANLVSAYILLSSENYYLKYSGYFSTFFSLLNLAQYAKGGNQYSALYQKLDSKIKNDYSYVRQYWSEFTFLKDMATWFNNLYLKIVGNKGVSSYDDKPTTDIKPDPDTGKPIEYIIDFSPIQKLYFSIFFS